MLILAVLLSLLTTVLNLPSAQAAFIRIFVPFNPLMNLSGLEGGRAALADLDNDGDLDILVGGWTFGSLEYLPNIGSAGSPAYASAIMNPFGLIINQEFPNRLPTLADLDNDGDLDLLIGEQYGSLNYYKNIGSAGSPAFASPVVNPFDLTDIGDASAPTLGDLDNDGDLDILVGATDGNLRYFQNTGSADSPAFATPLTNPFGLTHVGFSGWSAPALADLDNDGDLDILAGTNTGPLQYFQNIGSVSSPAFAAPLTNPFGFTDAGAFSLSAPALADLDNDGDLDALIGSLDTLYYFSNNGSASTPAFVQSTFNPFGLDNVLSQAAPALSDLDNDGDLDALVGNSLGHFYYFQNTGSANNPLFALPLFNPFGLNNTNGASQPVLADLDNDGDLDILAGENPGNLQYFQNIGSAGNPLFAAPLTNPFGLADVGFFSRPALGDLNNDGDLDALIGASDGNLYYFQNVGNANNPAFAAPLTNPFGLNNIGTVSAPTLIDFDNDGDLDVLVGSSLGNIFYFQNVGSAGSPAFAGPVLNPSGLADVGSRTTPILADLDNDADLDALVGRYDGHIIYFERKQIIADHSTYLPSILGSN